MLSEEHSPEQRVFSDELVIERGEHMQVIKLKERGKIAVRHPARIDREAGQQRVTRVAEHDGREPGENPRRIACPDHREDQH